MPDLNQDDFDRIIHAIESVGENIGRAIHALAAEIPNLAEAIRESG